MIVHFIGIGGIGTGALARIFHEKGNVVSGSDMEDSDLLNDLRKEGIDVVIGHSPSNLPENCELVIYSEAIPDTNAELVLARERNVNCKTYFEALGELTKEYRTIAICGTHGKTTTTAMAAKILMDAGFDPTVVIGGKMKELEGRNFRLGKSQWMVVEACEYRRSFLNLSPDIILITNIQYEHPDYYTDLDDYKKAFGSFVSKLKDKKAWMMEPNKVDFELQVPGEFNRENAGLAMQLAEYLEIPFESAKKSLQSFTGTWRRFEFKGKIGNTILIDDYAHHPLEIRETLKAAREKWPKKRILCIFQPHQYSRTAKFLDKFAQAFQYADEVIIPNIYRVRDTDADVGKIRPEKLVEEINKVTNNARYGGGLDKVRREFAQKASEFDIVIVMGAGDVGKVFKTS